MPYIGSHPPDTVCHSLFALPLGIIGRLCSVIGALSRHLHITASYKGDLELTRIFNIGIKHGFLCINIRQVPWEVLKTEAGGRGFQHLPRDLENVNALTNHVRSLLLHKN